MWGYFRVLKGEHLLKAVFSRKQNCPVELVPKMWVFRQFEGLNIKCNHWDPKRHILAGTTAFWVLCVKIRSGVWFAAYLKYQNTNVRGDGNWHVWGPTMTTFCMLADVVAINFGKNWSRVLAWKWVEFWPFPLTCVIVTETLQYMLYYKSVW